MELIHTCYRVTDPERSIAFYEALGLERRRELPIRDEAVNYFLGVPGQEIPELELTHNFGVDSYELGTGYGHVALTVEDLDSTLEKLAAQGIEPERAAVPGARGRLADLFRPGSGPVPGRADRARLDPTQGVLGRRKSASAGATSALATIRLVNA